MRKRVTEEKKHVLSPPKSMSARIIGSMRHSSKKDDDDSHPHRVICKFWLNGVKCVNSELATPIAMHEFLSPFPLPLHTTTWQKNSNAQADHRDVRIPPILHATHDMALADAVLRGLSGRVRCGHLLESPRSNRFSDALPHTLGARTQQYGIGTTVDTSRGGDGMNVWRVHD